MYSELYIILGWPDGPPKGLAKYEAHVSAPQKYDYFCVGVKNGGEKKALKCIL